MWSGAAELAPPANAAQAPNAVVESVSCAGAGSCAAVGSYTNATDVQRAMVASQTAGTWSGSAELALPDDADASGHGSLFSVACGAAGSCGAVGEYVTAGGKVRPLTTSRNDGTWSRSVGLEPTGDASATPVASFSAIACGAAASCGAIGFYRDDTGADLPLAATQADGHWSAATPIELPGDADASAPDATLVAIACGGPGSCTAVGSYKDEQGAYRPMAVAQAGDTWLQAVAIDIPAGSQAGLLSVACTAATVCVAGGASTDAGGKTHAIVTSLSGAGWTPADVLPAPADAGAADPSASVDTIACGATGACGASGSYVDAGGAIRTLVASQVRGSWSPAIGLQLPADADPTDPGSSEARVACGAAGACVLTGSYIDASRKQRPMVAWQADGTWSAAAPLAVPGNAQPNPDALVTSVACGAAWSCTAGGLYAAASGGSRAMVASAALGGPTPPTTPPSAPTTAPSAATATATLAAARPTVLVRTSRLVVAKGAIRIRLACRNAHCSGTIKLTTRARGKTVVLAKASYALVRGRSATVSMRLTRAGRKAFRHARAKAVRAKLVISVTGARTMSRTVTVR